MFSFCINFFNQWNANHDTFRWNHGIPNTVQSQTFETIQLKYTKAPMSKSLRHFSLHLNRFILSKNSSMGKTSWGEKPASIEWDDVFSIQLGVHNLREQLKATFQYSIMPLLATELNYEHVAAISSLAIISSFGSFSSNFDGWLSEFLESYILFW